MTAREHGIDDDAETPPSLPCDAAAYLSAGKDKSPGRRTFLKILRGRRTVDGIG
ncbi:hypothetical protein [Azospirillum doebereinerae]